MRPATRFRITVGGLLVLFVWPPVQGPVRAGPISARNRPFDATTIYQAPDTVYGMVAGEFDAAHPGVEVAILLPDGAVIELTHGPGGWQATPLAPGTFLSPIFDMGLRPSISIGDVHGGFPGNEIVVQGGQALTNIYFDPAAGWSHQPIADLSQLFGSGWGGRVGDLDPGRPGDEVFYVHEAAGDVSSGRIYREIGGVWELYEAAAYLAEVAMDSAMGDVNPDRPGDELIIVTEMGPTYEIVPPIGPQPTPWPKRTIWDDFDNAAWVVQIVDVDPATPGNEVVYGTRYINRIMISRHNGTGEHIRDILFTGPDPGPIVRNMWDIAAGNVIPESAALEILGVDNTGAVYLVEKTAGAWQGGTIWQASDGPKFAVVAGDFDPSHDGDEILAAGQSGAVTLLTPRPAGLLGDVNCDTNLNGLDVGAFALGLLDPAGYELAFPGCNLLNGDIDGDGSVTPADIGGFVALLIGS